MNDESVKTNSKYEEASTIAAAVAATEITAEPHEEPEKVVLSVRPKKTRRRTKRGEKEKRKTRREKQKRGPWTKKEDETLLTVVKKYGAQNWTYLSQFIPLRVGKQCRERYYNHLDPNVRREPWSSEEDELIIKYHDMYGNKWTDISKAINNGRPPNSIKNRWNSTLKRRLMNAASSSDVAEDTPQGRNTSDNDEDAEEEEEEEEDDDDDEVEERRYKKVPKTKKLKYESVSNEDEIV